MIPGGKLSLTSVLCSSAMNLWEMHAKHLYQWKWEALIWCHLTLVLHRWVPSRSYEVV